MTITGKTLIDWGIDPKNKGKWFGEAIANANSIRRTGGTDEDILAWLRENEPQLPPEMPLRTNALPIGVFIEPESDLERANVDAVITKMDEYMRVPVVKAGAVLPDACPTGDMPVGTVIASEAIHPGFHSPDVCCSMAITVFKRQDDLKRILDVAQSVTHFGPGGRKDGWLMPKWLRAPMDENRFLADRASKYGDVGDTNLGTQGDGNHFLFVGTLRSTGQPAIVTHHGSRGVGALLYKRGMAIAKRHTAIHSPRTPDKAAWISHEDTWDYFRALKLVREWTKLNHFLIHDAIQQRIGNRIEDRFWNEHNFVFRRNGLFYHAKGATPSFAGFSVDDDGRTLIPMNMAEPILLARHRDKPEALGFAPHGAGRNYSRTHHLRQLEERFTDGRGVDPNYVQAVLEAETKDLDVRSYSGVPDLSELPSAYKNAAQVQAQITKHGLADVYDYVDPYGTIMAGEQAWDRRKR